MNDVVSKVNWATSLIAFVLAVVAGAKLFGFHVPIPGAVLDTACVAGALALAKLRLS